ncbi:hypothetical protein [Nocardioides plantarum]|uniref:Lipoprotein n=1 Tax=Nocardioides plantarum TaxID=29299 RepID=A0ABV5K609_9ACTN|nr:hypothetical protein [Nocardioides plantarum]
MTASTTRLLTTVVLAPLAALGVVGCRSDDSGTEGPGPGGTLTIVSSDWNGWDPEHTPTPRTTTLPASVGSSVTVDSIGETLTFEVARVGGGEVAVSSSRELAPEGETGGSNLNDLVDEFTVERGAETVLDTPTLDGGYSYTFTLS